MVETIDRTHSDISKGVAQLRTHAGMYRNPKAATAEIDKLSAILAHDKTNVVLAYRIARLHLAMGEYKKSLMTITTFQGRQDNRLNALEGYLNCLSNASDPTGVKYRAGRALIQKATSVQPDAEALSWLAETAYGESDGEVAALWERAYRCDPTDPHALAGHLRYTQRSALEHTTTATRALIVSAMELCRKRISVGVNLPHSLYYLAEFHLLQSGKARSDEEKKHAYQALYTLARAISLTHDPRILHDALAALKRLHSLDQNLVAAEWGRRALLLAVSVRFHNGGIRLHDDLKPTNDPDLARYLQTHSKSADPDSRRPVLIVAGGCDPKHEGSLKAYSAELDYALKDFRGTVICGGTTQGISGIIGKILKANRRRLTGIGYLPSSLEPSKSVTIDSRYKFLPPTDGKDEFTPLEPIQGWVDLLSAGIHPQDVTLLGVNGGKVAGFEYHMASTLGADVGIVEESGRVADDLALQQGQPGNEGIRFLPADRDVLRVFIGGQRPQSLTEQQVDQLAAEVKKNYEQTARSQEAKEREMSKSQYPELQRVYNDSNRAQIMDIEAKLDRIGLRIESIQSTIKSAEIEIKKKDFDRMARWEHARYVTERLRKGFRPGERDDAKKLNPTLVAWENLPDSERQKDIDAVQEIPNYVKSIGFRIVKK
jgi:hypothetical protein